MLHPSLPGQNRHISTSSSVYSQPDPKHANVRTYEIHPEVEEEEEEEEGDQDHAGFDYVTNPISNQTLSSYATVNTHGIAADSTMEQPQLYDASMRSTPSFSSINASLFHNPSPTGSIVDDTTPKLDSSSSYYNNSTLQQHQRSDSIDDKTPLIGADGFILEDVAKQSSLPQQKLNSRFKRLSRKLQNKTTTGDSHQFMNNFQQNIEKANNLAVNSQDKQPRESSYYQKIHESFHDEEDDRQHDQYSMTTASITSAASSSNLSSASDTSSFEFSNKEAAYTISGNRISTNKTTDEIPIRKDLLDRVNTVSDTRVKDLTEQEKIKLFIATKGNLNNGLNIMTPENSDSNSMSDGESVSSETNNAAKVAKTAYEAATMAIAEQQEEDLSSLFIKALHPFDSSTLQSEVDASICLSFNKNDLAFVHTIDESGWGEVTLIDSLQRGWIPINYFAIAIADDEDDYDEDNEIKIPNSHYLKPLFHSCGKFLLNPLSSKIRNNKYTFSIKVVNSIRDGVRLLLQETDCLSRSNELVTKKPVVRKSRKSLLADWYNLMVKANEFKNTSSFNKIEILTLMVYQVTRKAVSFLEIWSVESEKIIRKESIQTSSKTTSNGLISYSILSTPPLAKQRITEINGILFSYLGLILGRLDLIEHNQVGCDILETITHQIILLLRELLYISKLGSTFTSERPQDLDSSLDCLLSLVSDLVSTVKALVSKTMNESTKEKVDSFGSPQFNGTRDYHYTQEGGNLIIIASKMVKAISMTVTSIRKLLDVTGDFKLKGGGERTYPDYSKMTIDPQEFVRKCSLGIAKNLNNNEDLKNFTISKPFKSNRYSLVRSGKSGDLGFTESGVTLMQSILTNENLSSPFTVATPEFQQFTSDSEGESDINNELLVDSNGNLLGASFKGLIYTLTNEDSPPDYFFVSTFFICFRNFANGIDLIEQLISRFEVETLMDSTSIKLKKRRRLIVKMFQIWIESYWNSDADYSLLTTLINFFNEGVCLSLPLDGLRLLEIAAKLSSHPLIENEKNRHHHRKSNKQLVDRNITMIRKKNERPPSILSDNESTFSMVDGYELSRINTNSSTSSSIASLPLPLGIGNQKSSAGSLLTRSQLHTIENLNLAFRSLLRDSWCETSTTNKKYQPVETSVLINNWFEICDQTWVLSNYRPNLLDFNGLELAKQLTLVESQIFCCIRPEELLNQNYTAKRAHLKLAPNVRTSLLFTNCLSSYVLESILQPKISVKLRVNIIKTWLKVAISCLYLRNFNSLAAIITSLQSHLITRLSVLWEQLSEKYTELYDYLSSIIHPDKNYAVYRNKLRKFLISNEYNIPIVPYFSLFLQDLTFVTDGNPNYRKANTFLNQKLINIDKYLKTTRIIADIESLQISYLDKDDLSSQPKRYSFLSLSKTTTSSNDGYFISPAPALQELILLELWKIIQLNNSEEDRAWKLSCAIQSKDSN
ncbi:Bud site selection protein 5 [Spathaspora sp. JA1]|nr:Bud site selection protein 5 [Spathaspora sp. JA1]